MESNTLRWVKTNSASCDFEPLNFWTFFQATATGLRETNRLLSTYLDTLRARLVEGLADLAIPSEQHGASQENIDKYMTDLQNMATSNSHGPASLNRAKDIIRKTDLHIPL